MIDKENCHILLVQEELNALLMERFLELDGFKNIYKASSGNDAFLILEEITPDLIVLFDRPLEENGPTGIDLFRWFKQLPKLKKTSFLLYQIILHRELCQELKDMGFSGVLGHPLEVRETSKACSIVLDGGTYYRDCDKYW
jgi:DNA-binding NarL/FixJ family response regulator